MQPGVIRILLARLSSPLLDLVLAGLLLAALAALALAGPAIAGEAGPKVPPVPWQYLPADGGEAGLPQSPAGLRGLTAFELVVREADDGVRWHGLFFRAGDGLRIGAEGSFNPASGGLWAIFSLKLDF